MKPLRLLKKFYTDCFINRDIDKAVSVLCDDTDLFLASSGENISGIDNIKEYIEKNIFSFSGTYKAIYTDEWEKVTDEEKGTGAARIKANYSDGAKNYYITISIISSVIKGKTRIYSITLFSSSAAEVQDKADLQAADKSVMPFLDIASFGVMISNYNLNTKEIDVQYINPTLKQILGYELNSSVLEKNWWAKPFTSINQSEIQKTIDDFLDCIKNLKDFNVTNTLEKKDGSTLFIKISMSFLPVSDGIVKCFAIFTDITNEDNGKDELNRMLERFKQILEVSNTIAFDYDCIEDTIDYSTYIRNGHPINNCIRNYLRSDNLDSRIYCDDKKLCIEAVDELMKQPSVKSLEIRTSLYSKIHSWNRLTLVSLSEKDGKVRHIIGRIEDIQKEKEQELIYNQIKLQKQSLMKDLISSYCFNLSKGTIEDIYMKHNEFQLVSGIHIDDEVFQKALASRLPNSSEREEYMAKFAPSSLRRNYDQGIYESKMEFRKMLPDKSISWVELHFTTVLNPITNEIMAFGTGRDITSRKNAQLAMTVIACRDYKLITIVNAERGNYQTFKVENQENVMRSGESYDDDMIGYIADKYISLANRESFISEMKLTSVIKTLSVQNSGSYTVDVIFEDGHIEKRQFTFFYINDEHTIFVVCDRNVTETVKKQEDYEKQMQDALNSAKSSAKAKNDFFSRVSHEMRTPLNAILGFSSYGAEMIDKKDEVLSSLKDINTSGEYLLGLINDILDVSKIESKKVKLNNEIVNLLETLQTVTKMAASAADRYGVKINTSFNVSNEVYIKTDSMRLRQIFMNLLNNAVKFSPLGSKVEFNVMADVVSEKSVHFIAIIRDYGCGMSDEFQMRMYEPFEQEQNEYSKIHIGTGLGLSIVKSLVELMNGRISCYSKLGFGTEFTLEFNEPLENAPNVVKKDDNATFDVKILEGRRVLLCEDVPMNVKIETKLLEKVGVASEHAENGKIGVEMFNNSPDGYYDAILMDVRMPVMDGIEATTEIRKGNHPRAKTIPIIALTANAYTEDICQTLDAGMNAHIVKPLVPDRMYRVLAELLSEEDEVYGY